MLAAISACMSLGMLWHMHGLGKTDMSKGERLKFWPTDAEVEAALPLEATLP